jgi:hypothetical protein
MVFIPTSVYVENQQGGDPNAIPPGHERRANSLFWQFIGSALGLQVPVGDNEGVTPEIAAMRRRDERIRALNTPPPPADLGTVIEGAVDTIVEVAAKVVRVTKIDLAKAFLLEKLSADGTVAQRDIQEQGKLAGHTLKNLTIGKQRLGVKSFKKGGKWWWTLGRTAKMDG